MNYEKKRKRQSGRQKQKPRVIFDEWNKLHAEIDRLIEAGILPTIHYDPTPIIYVANYGKSF